MKNIDKYTETRAAAAAYRKWFEANKDSMGIPMPMQDWLLNERRPTLSEAAEAVLSAWKSNVPSASLANIRDEVAALAGAVNRNCDKYLTADEAIAAFIKFIRRNKGKSCADNTSFADWLFSEPEQEGEAK